MLAVLKATLSFSVETDLPKLVRNLLWIVLQHAAASRCTLVLRNELISGWDEALSVATDPSTIPGNRIDETDPDQPELSMIVGGNLHDLVPMSVLNYVTSTREMCLLNTPQNETVFSTDSYFTKHQPKAALMFPILHQVSNYWKFILLNLF